MLKKELIYRLTTNCFDKFDKISLVSLLDISQSIAGEHANELKIGFDDYRKDDKTWLIISNRFSLLKPIKVEDVLKVVTTPRPSEHFHCDRDYFFYNDENELVVKGTSKWIVYDLKNKRLLPCKDVFADEEFSEEFAYSEKTSKLVLPPQNEFQFALKHRVTNSEIDHNNHFNNTKFLNLFYDVFDLTNDDEVSEFQIDYIDQCFLGDEIKVYSAIVDKKYYYTGMVRDKNVFQACITMK